MLRFHLASFLLLLSITTMHSFVFRRFQKQPLGLVARITMYGLPKFEPMNLSKEQIRNMGHPLSLSFPDLAQIMGGNGRAKIIWDHLKNGVDPLLTDDNADLAENLSSKSKGMLREALDGRPLIPGEVTEETVSECGTRKLLIKMVDGQSIEAVLIPSSRHGRTTLCVSSQIGCDRGCKFCLTGKMGLVRNLVSAEIVAQVILGMRAVREHNMPPLKNIVFMGMGDAGRNLKEVTDSVQCLTDTLRMRISAGKITVSTVGPSPEVFDALTKLQSSTAWSLHTPDAALRKKLVPSSYKYSPQELRDQLMVSLEANKKPGLRTVMIAITLIQGVNDAVQDATALADFLDPMRTVTEKVVIDLIPYNDIHFEGFKQPVYEQVCAFQEVLKARGFFTSVRITRGDKDSSACGMLATKVIKRTRPGNVAIEQSI